MVKTLPTGAARLVTDSVERARAVFKDRPEWTPHSSGHKPSRRSQRPEPEAEPEPVQSTEDEEVAAELGVPVNDDSDEAARDQ